MKLPEFIINWYSNRKITKEILEEFNIQFENNHIVIPIMDENGKIIFNKYRRSPLNEEGSKYKYDKGGKMSIYALHKIKNKKQILWVEGENDCLVAWSHNIPAITSTGGCMGIKDEWKDTLSDKELIFCFDNDEAGGRGMAKAFNLFPSARLIFLPDRVGVKDLSDYVSSGGDIHALIRGAKHFEGVDDIITDQADRRARWQSTFFHDAYLREYNKPAQEKIFNFDKDDDISKANSVPITRIVKFNTQYKARCIYHNEKTASMTYFTDSNKVYCFGCNKIADTIDVYRTVNNCSFLEAVNALKKFL